MLGELHGCPVGPPQSSRPAKVLQLRLTPEILEQLRGSGGEGISISFDADMSLRIGQHNHSFSLASESTIVDVFRCSKRSKRTSLESIGSMTHKLTMRRELGNSISEKLKSRQAEEAAARQERSVQSTEIGVKTKKGMPTMTPTLSHVRPEGQVRRSPFLQPRKSPLLVASSPKPAQVPLRTRLIQTVAIGAATEVELSSRLKVPAENLETLLREIAIKTGNAWALKDEMFKDIKVWDWKGYTTAERTAVISRASEALDRLSIPPKHIARIRLVHPEKRTADERNDTSPLSLNAPVTAASLSRDLSPKKDNVDAKSILPIATRIPEVDSRTSSPAPEKKVTAKGILTSGKKLPEKKKRIIEESTGNDVQRRKKQKTSATDNGKVEPSSGLCTNPAGGSLSTTQNAAVPGGVPRKKRLVDKAKSPESIDISEGETKSLASKECSAKSVTKSQVKSTSAKIVNGDDQTDPPKSTCKPNAKLQTPTAVPAKVAPSASSQDSAEEESNNRTSSITSSTTERSDRSLISTSSVSTVPSSISSTPVKIRSKFLTTKRTMPPTVPARVTLPTTARSAPAAALKSATASPVVVQEVAKTGAAAVGACKKRTADPDSPSEEPPLKRVRTIDLQNMAREYKRLYPEYKLLHDKVTARVDDQSLFSRFMKMHNQMSTWKQTLYAAEKDYE